jgi:hypothetical protein
MTDKLLDKIDSMLDGTGRYKLFDPRRKAVLALPANAFKLWMTYWAFESDDQEAYPCMETLMEAMQTSEPTILRARKYLIETGWLVKVAGSAAGRYSKPTNGAWNVAIYRVNDPTAKEMIPPAKDLTVGAKDLIPPAKDSLLYGKQGKEMTEHILLPNGAFALASTGTTTLTPTHAATSYVVDAPSGNPSLRETEKQNPAVPVSSEPTQNPTPRVHPPNSASPPAPDKEPELTWDCGKCGESFPYNPKGNAALDTHLLEVHGIKPLI